MKGKVWRRRPSDDLVSGDKDEDPDEGSSNEKAAHANNPYGQPFQVLVQRKRR